MKKLRLTIILSLITLTIQAQEPSIWKKVNQKDISSIEKNKSKNIPEDMLLFQLNEIGMKNTLSKIDDKAVSEGSVVISIPNANGVLEKFTVHESSNFAPELQTKYPEIRSYKGIGITDKTATVYFSNSPRGIQTMIVRADKDSEFIESYSNTKSIYKLITSKNRSENNSSIACSTKDMELNTLLQNKVNKVKASDKVFRTFRLALSCNAEYTNYFGGTLAGALAGMNASMTRINGVLGKDLAVKFEIIANNDLLIYLDPLTDPYSDASIGTEDDPVTGGRYWNSEIQKNLTATIGNAGYDVGHLLSSTIGTNGIAGSAGGIGYICTNPTPQRPLGKGCAWSAASRNLPEGPDFDIDLVAHEMGHQLGGNHTFSYAVEGRGANIEPGSGSTIMAYAGSQGFLDIQAHSDDYFSVNTIQQIQALLASKTCSTNISISNDPPIINAGSDYTIPKGTAFILKGIGSDPNGDIVSYTWEQNDNAVTETGANSICFPTKVDGPLFRSFKPSNSLIRYMPAQKDVLSNILTTKWESVSNIERTLNFFLTGRDNAAIGTSQTNSDDMNVRVNGSVGPFTVTSQNTEDIGWSPGSSQAITWNVNGAETLAGAAYVNIKLSIDGGQTFPIFLATNTPNDGTENIISPNIAATNCRLIIEPTNNIFYAVNSKVFAVGYSVTSECNSYPFSNLPFAIPDGSPTYTTRTVSVPTTSAVLVDVNVSIGVQHTFMPDLQIEIQSPQNTTVILQKNGCGSNLNVNYDDAGNVLNCNSTTIQNAIPKEQLSVFNGQNPSNIWTLKFRDASGGDAGTLNSATLNICTKKYISLGKNNLNLADFVMYPNPSKGQFNIRFSSQSENDIAILVHDLLGRKVFENKYNKTSSNFNEDIQLKNVNSGVYLLTVIDGDRKEEKKLIIE